MLIFKVLYSLIFFSVSVLFLYPFLHYLRLLLLCDTYHKIHVFILFYLFCDTLHRFAKVCHGTISIVNEREVLIMKNPLNLFLIGCLAVLDALCLYGSAVATTSGNIFICWLCASFLSVLIFFSVVLCCVSPTGEA